MSLRRIVRTSLISLAIAIATLVCCSFLADYTIRRNAQGKTYNDAQSLPHIRVGLLLGTSRLNMYGSSNSYFEYRIRAATELFQRHVIDDLIISGDNSRVGYDEPSDMRAALIEAGVDSTHLYLDYAGFRTFDSIVRAHEIFGQDSLLIISQQFHNERAIYIAEHIGLVAVGFNAANVDVYYGGFRTLLREKFARIRTHIDFLIGTRPHFGGSRIMIKGNDSTRSMNP